MAGGNGRQNGRASISFGLERPVRVAVVGVGYWGPNLVRNLHEVPEADVIAVCDASNEALDRITRRYPALDRTTGFSDILANPLVDAVVIATPVSTHYRLAAEALQAGKHVFVEKPLAGSARQARELIALADERSLVLMPGHTFLYSPPVNIVRDLIQSSDLGDIHFISSSRVNLGLHQPDVSVVWDLGPHDFSILLYWLSETPSHVTALSRSCILPDTPDVAFINLEFASGCIAHVELAWLAPSKLRRTAIVGSRKMVVYDDTSTEPVRVFDSGVDVPDPGNFGEYKLTYRTGDIVSPPIGSSEPLALELGDFCASIRAGSIPRSSSRLGLEVLRVIEAVDRSLSLRGARVPVDLDQAGSAVAAVNGSQVELEDDLRASRQELRGT